nr:hypothetical protein [Lactococcus lactis]
MGNRIFQLHTQKPAISDIDFTFFDGLAHGLDIARILNEREFN